MAGYPSLPVRVWRTMLWRRNPLMRGSDRLESGLMVLAVMLVLLAIPVAAAIGSTVFVSTSATAQQQATTRHQTTAVVVANEPASGFSVNPPATTKVQWTVGGAVHDGTVAARGAKVGDQMTIWTDDSGNQTSPPMTGAQAIGEAVGTAFLCWSIVGGTLLLLMAVLRRLLNRHRYAQWGREWRTIANSRGWASP